MELKGIEIVIETGSEPLDEETITLNPEDELVIDESSIEKELTRIAQSVARYGHLAAILKAQLARKEEEIDAVDAAIDSTLRDHFKTLMAGDPKLKMPTETQLKKNIRNDPLYKDAIDGVAKTRLYYYQVDNLFRAFIKKAEALNALSYYQRQERKVY